MNWLTDIRAVTFDAGGTLFEPWPSVGHVYSDVAAEHGWPGLSPANLNERFIAAWKSRGTFDYSRRAWAELVDLTFAGLCDPLPSASFFDAIYDRFKRPDVWRVYDDVRSVLESLRAGGLKLAIISNWDERLGPLLDRLQLAPFFEVITVSHFAGAQKPSAQIFMSTATQLELAPKAILHVGDSEREDFNGALAAGFRAAWLTRGAARAGPRGLQSLRELCPSENG